MAQLDVDPSPQEQVEPVAGRKPMPFFPDFALIEAITALCFLVALLIVAALTEPSLEETADPRRPATCLDRSGTSCGPSRCSSTSRARPRSSAPRILTVLIAS